MSSLGPVSILFVPLITALALAGCSDTPTSGEVITLRIGTVAAPGSLIAATSEEFARRIEERLRPRVEVIVFNSSQLGNDEVMLQKLKLGTLDFSVPSTIMSSVVAEFGLFEMPYLVEDREHMRRIGQEIFWPQIAPIAEAEGYRVVGLWENGFRQITNNVRPIAAPEDLDGIKLRTPRGQWRVRLFQSIGANPTPMPLSEVFVALQTGVIDGQENPLAHIASFQFDEVQEYLSLTNHLYSPAYLIAGLDGWRRLPEDVRGVLEEVASQIQEYTYAEAERMDTTLLADLRDSGIRINEADRVRFLEASRPIYEEFGEAVAGGRQLIEAAGSLQRTPAAGTSRP
jgi:tripartite ATP-independent transporter DctP family solute receptor